MLDESSPNAFATGRDPQHASIAVTRGLMERLNREELQGVVAHEMSARPQLRHPLRDAGRHPRGDDRAGRRLLPALELLGRHRPPPRRRLGRRPGRARSWSWSRSCSRSIAPRGCVHGPVRGVAPSRVPRRRVRGRAHAEPARPGAGADPHRRRPRPSSAHANRATAHLYIANPLKKDKEVTGVFDTHPPIQERIALLLAMAHAGPEALAERPVTARPSRRSRGWSSPGRAPARCPRPPRRRSNGGAAALAAAGRLSRRRRAAPVGLAARVQGAGQPQVAPRLLPAPQLAQAASQRVVGVVVVRDVLDDARRSSSAARSNRPDGEQRPPQGLADGVAPRLEPQGSLEVAWRPGRVSASRKSTPRRKSV